MDGATESGTEARMSSGVFKRKIVELEEFKLVYGESKGPGDVFGHEELRWCVRLGDEGHV